MNRYAEKMLKAQGRDHRNPYGSRGGYVRDSAGRNYKNEIVRSPSEMDYRMRDRARSGGRSDYRGMQRRSDYANNRDYADYNDYNMDYGYGYGVGMFDYDTEDYGEEEPKKLSAKDIKKWEKEIENADGTKGAKFDVQRIRQLAQQQDVQFEEYSPETMTMVANMLYSDYCKVLGGDAMLYIRLAKAFLEDDDFDGEPEEKVMLYYKCIVEKDD